MGSAITGYRRDRLHVLERIAAPSQFGLAAAAAALGIAGVVDELLFSGFIELVATGLGELASAGTTLDVAAAVVVPLLALGGSATVFFLPRWGGVLLLGSAVGLVAWLGVEPRSLLPLACSTAGACLALISAVREHGRRHELFSALTLAGPLVLIYLLIFYYPTYKMVALSLTDGKLIGGGDWVGLTNYMKLAADKLFKAAVVNTGYFVILTVIPGTLVGLAIAMMVNRLNGYLQSVVLAAFFLPFILPVSVVYLIWQWVFDLQYGVAQYVFDLVPGERVPVFRSIAWFLPVVGFVTIWWTCGFNILVYLAGLRAIPRELYEAASLDGANRWQLFARITWPLIWPVTALVATIQLILQLKIFDQVYLFSIGGRTDATMVMVQYVYKRAFIQNQGGYAAAVAMALFLVIVVFSVLQYQFLRLRGPK